MVFGIDDVIGAGLQIANKLIPNAEAKEQNQLANATLKANEVTTEINAISQVDVAQANINQAEAVNNDLFDKWRDFIGWVCGIALGWQAICVPILLFALALLKINIIPPSFDMKTLDHIIMGMLGLAAMHSFDKYNS